MKKEHDWIDDNNDDMETSTLTPAFNS